MRVLVPSFIYEQAHEGRSQGCFPAVVLFVDISGSTALTEAMMRHGKEGAERLAGTLRALFTPLLDTVSERGGFVAYFAGDAFVALFPDPDDECIRQALTAAWQICAQVSQRDPIFTDAGTFHFGVDVSVSVGEVHWGIVTGGGRKAYYFAGPAIDDAIQGEGEAEAGDILLSSAIYDRVIPLVEVEPRGTRWRLCALDCVGEPAIHSSLPSPTPVAGFVPPLLEALPHQGEFRQVVTLFLNLRAPVESPELSAFLTRCLDLLQGYGGYLARIARIGAQDPGFTLLIFWGAPASHENDLERALEFLLALQAESPLPLRGGLTQGMVYAGFIGGGQREEFTCYGSSVNLAARQMGQAPWGQIVVEEVIAQRAQPRFWLETLGEVQFRGVKGSRRLYGLRGRRLEGARRRYHTPLIGRADEAAAVEGFLAPLAEGHHAGLLLIQGEAGVGKSRLVHEVSQRLPYSYFFCQVDQTLRLPLNPFRYWLRHYFNPAAGTDTEVNRQHFTEQVDTLLAGAPPTLQAALAQARSFLGALVDLYWPDSPYEQLEPRLRLENILDALKTLIKVESLRRPVILHIEDAHWLDSDSQRALLHLQRETAAFPFALLLTGRPVERLAEVESVMPGERLTLAPLSESATSRLVTALLKGRAVPALQDQLMARSGGNPFFIEQLAQALQEAGKLQATREGWDTQAVNELLPADVRTLLVARLDRLPLGLRDLIQRAAILGQEFNLSLLAQLGQVNEAKLAAALALGEQAAIWEPRSESHYRFYHALLRDVAYDMQLVARRQQLHQEAGSALEHLYREDLAPYWGELAHHYEEAGVLTKAHLYLERAGDGAKERFQNETALHYYGRLLALPSLSPAERAALHLKQGEVLQVIGRWDEAAASFSQAHDLAVSAGVLRLQAWALKNLGWSCQARGHYEAALTYTQQALALYERLGDHKEIALALKNKGVAHWRRGENPEALQCYQRGLAEAEQAGDRYGMASHLCNMGLVYWKQAAYERAIEHYHQALEHVEALEHKQGIAINLGNLGLIFAEQGHLDQAEAHYRRALVYYEEIGDKNGIALMLGNLGILAKRREHYGQALDHYHQALAINKELGQQEGSIQNQINLGNLYYELGQDEKALSYYQAAHRLAETIGNRQGLAFTLGYVARIRARQGRTLEAAEGYEAAIRLSRTLQANYILAEQLIEYAALLYEQGACDRAQVLNSEGLQLARQGKVPELITRAVLMEARLLAVQGAHAEAQQLLQERLDEQVIESDQAALRLALWQVGAGEAHAREALRLYQALCARSERAIYRQHLRMLEQAGIALP